MTTETINREMDEAVAESLNLNRLRRDRGRRDDITSSIPFGYYKNREGWVDLAEGYDTHQGIRLRDIKGWAPLSQYPRVINDVERRQPFHAILRADGEQEFPPAQIVSLGWDKKPPRILTCDRKLDDFNHPQHFKTCFKIPVFPQMNGVVVYTDTCSLCRWSFSSVENNVEQMTKKHMEVMHRDHLVNKELVTGLRDALAGNDGKSNDELIQLITATVAATMQSMGVVKNKGGRPRKTAECQTCGGAIEGRLADHTCLAAQALED